MWQLLTRRRRGIAVLTMAALPLVLSGCAGMADDARASDLCAQYHQLVSTANKFQEQDAAQAKADELRTQADHFRDELNQVQAVSEGRLDTAATNLETRLDDLRASTSEAGAELRSTLVPLWKDDLQQIAEAWGVLREAAATQCPG